MITEYIKRQQKMGFDETGTLVYKIPMEETFVTEEQEETPTFFDLDEDEEI